MYVVQHRRLKHRQPAQSESVTSEPGDLGTSELVVGDRFDSPADTGSVDRRPPRVSLASTAGPISFGDPLVVGSAVVGVVMIGFFLWLLRAEHLGGRQIALRTLYAFGFLLVTLIGLQVLTGGHRSTRTSAQQTRIVPDCLIGPDGVVSPMNVQVVYCSHQTTPLAVRERLAFASSEAVDARLSVSADEFPRNPSTSCFRRATGSRSIPPRRRRRRTPPEHPPTEEQVAEFLSQFHGIPRDDFYGTLLAQKGPEAVRHLFEVSSSLDSMVLGEPQIVNQVKEAYRIAQENDACGPLTNALFQGAMRVSARVRTRRSWQRGGSRSPAWRSATSARAFSTALTTKPSS